MPDKERIKYNFSRSARSYDDHAHLQKVMADDLLRGVKNLAPKRIVDIGCGTGYLTRRLAGMFSQAEVLGIDFAPGMIEVAHEKSKHKNLTFHLGDGERLPAELSSFDLVVSNASMQWMNTGRVLRSARRVLGPRGRFIFNTFGPLTLWELKESGFRVNEFPPVCGLKAQAECEFSDVGIDSKIIKQRFRSVKQLIYYLREIGAHTVTDEAAPGGEILSAFRKYHQKYRLGKFILATFEVITCTLVV